MARAPRVSFAQDIFPAREEEAECPACELDKSETALEGAALHTQFTDGLVLDPFLSVVQKENCKTALKLLLDKSKGCLGRKRIEEEFLDVQSGSKTWSNKTCNVAQEDRNIRKNRYRNVLAYDDTRVVLKVQQGCCEERTDYINANHIEDGVMRGIPKYIATQAPLPDTVIDFWEMVFQQHSPAVVMLARESFPNGKTYFPEHVNEHMVHGRLLVTNVGVLNKQGPVVKRFLLVQDIMNKEEELPVAHYEYVAWPDMGVPNSGRGVREVMRNVYPFPKNVGPMVVHCRAGMGRSGSFITIMDSMYRILNGDFSAVDMHKTVRRFRMQRTGLVETVQMRVDVVQEQYRFCYQAVMEEVHDLCSKDFLAWKKHNVVKGMYHIPWPQRSYNTSTL